MGAILEPIFYILSILMDLYVKVIVIEVILNWCIALGIVSTSNDIVARIEEFLNKLTEPLYKIVRRYIPPIAGIDISPVVLILFMIFAQRLVYRIGELLI